MTQTNTIPLQLANAWLSEPKKQYIDGQWVAGEGEEYASINPANCKELCRIPPNRR